MRGSEGGEGASPFRPLSEDHRVHRMPALGLTHAGKGFPGVTSVQFLKASLTEDLVFGVAPARGCRWKREVLCHGDFYHSRAIDGESRLHRIPDILRTVHIEPARAVNVRQFVEARIVEIHADIARIPEALLLCLLRP